MKIKTLKEREKQHLLEVLHKTGWNLEMAARLLQIPIAQLKRKISQYGLAGRQQTASAGKNSLEASKEADR